MKAGRLRHWIIIEKKLKSRDSYGSEVISWSTDLGTWASIQPLRGMKYLTGLQLMSNISHQVTMRYQTLGNTTQIGSEYCRVRFGDRILNIMSAINPDERNISLELMCKEQ
jgi:SPP1 family predicted phage head-tail adaptor